MVLFFKTIEEELDTLNEAYNNMTEERDSLTIEISEIYKIVISCEMTYKEKVLKIKDIIEYNHED